MIMYFYDSVRIIPDKPFESVFSVCIQEEEPWAAQMETEGTILHATSTFPLLRLQGTILNMAMLFIK